MAVKKGGALTRELDILKAENEELRNLLRKTLRWVPAKDSPAARVHFAIRPLRDAVRKALGHTQTKVTEED